jgi:hypothetical protein
MRLKFWVDIFSYTNESNVFPTNYPSMPKPPDCRRYMITCEIPDLDGDADHLITAEVKAE